MRLAAELLILVSLGLLYLVGSFLPGQTWRAFIAGGIGFATGTIFHILQCKRKGLNHDVRN